MNGLKIFIAVLLAFYTTSEIKAQSDHLEPVNGIFDSSNSQLEYYSKVRKILFQGLNYRPTIRFLIIPSFSSESVLEIAFDRTTKKNFIVYQVCDKNIWYSKNRDSTTVTRKRKEISSEAVELVNKLFEAAIERVEYQKEPFLGCDGERYFFSVNKFGLKTGMTWSPDKETKMRRLVDIGLALVKLATNENIYIQFDNSLKSQIIQLTNELK